MKLAYIATDLSALKNIPLIHSQNYSTIHFYLSHKNPVEEYSGLDKLDILAENLNLNAQGHLRTPAQKNLAKKIKISQDSFISNIYSGRIVSELNAEDLTDKSIHEVYLLEDITYLKYNREILKYSIENLQKQIVEYDYLLIENNQYIMDSIVEKQQNLFLSFTEQSRCLLTLEYRQSKILPTYPNNREFILIDNTEMNAVFDNWYLVSIKSNTLRCAMYIPFEMKNNEDYLGFLQNRVKSVLLRNLPYLSDLVYSTMSTSPVDGYYRHKAQLRHSKSGALIPKYFLWSDEKRKAHLQNVLKNKNNLKQILLEKNWKRDAL